MLQEMIAPGKGIPIYKFCYKDTKGFKEASVVIEGLCDVGTR